MSSPVCGCYLLCRLGEFLTAFNPTLDAAELNLVLETVVSQYGRRTGGPATAPSIGHDGLVARHFRQTAFKFVDRDVVVALDYAVLH